MSTSGSDSHHRSQRVEQLKSECKTRRFELADQVAHHHIRPEGADYFGWGQYLRLVNGAIELPKKPGIFGTSAALQVLSLQSPEEYSPKIVGGLRILPLLSESSEHAGTAPSKQVQERFRNKGDLDVVYKLCAELEVATTLSTNEVASIPQPDPARLVSKILNAQVPSSGWPDFSRPDGPNPNPHATSVALMSLSSYGARQDVGNACISALRWFANLRMETLSIASIAMVSIAVDRLMSARPNSAEPVHADATIRKLKARTEDEVLKWMGSTSPVEILRSLEGTEYQIPITDSDASAGSSFTFLFYLPHCLTTLAILSSRTLRKRTDARRFVVSVVSIISSKDQFNNAFIAAGRTLVSTVEQLWIYRVLYEFERSELYPSRASVLRDRIAERKARRIFLSVLSVLFLVGLVVVASVTTGPIAIALTALVAFLGGVVSALAVSLLEKFT